MSLKESFIQIQKILTVVSNDKSLSQEFTNLKTIKEKFNFTTEKCKDYSIDGTYSIEEFEKFLLFTNALYELSSEDSSLKKLDNIKDIDVMYEMVMKKVNQCKIDFSIDKVDFEAFIQSSENKIAPLSYDNLDKISGGDAIDKAMAKHSQYHSLFIKGQQIAVQIQTLKSLFK